MDWRRSTGFVGHLASWMVMPVTERGDSPEMDRTDFGFREPIVHPVDSQEDFVC